MFRSTWGGGIRTPDHGTRTSAAERWLFDTMSYQNGHRAVRFPANALDAIDYSFYIMLGNLLFLKHVSGTHFFADGLDILCIPWLQMPKSGRLKNDERTAKKDS